MPSQRHINLGHSLLPAPYFYAAFKDETVSFSVEGGPPHSNKPGFTIESTNHLFFGPPEWEGTGEGKGIAKFRAKTAGIAQIRCGWADPGSPSRLSHAGICVVVLPETSKPPPDVGAVRHLIVQGPDGNFYLFSPGQTEATWPQIPFMHSTGKKFLEWFPGGRAILSNQNKVIGAMLTTTFTGADGNWHSFYIINLKSLLQGLKEGKNPDYRSLKIRGPDGLIYAIPDVGDWPTSPLDPQPLYGHHLFARVQDERAKSFLYDLGETLRFFNPALYGQGPFPMVASLASQKGGVLSYRFYEVHPEGFQPAEHIAESDRGMYENLARDKDILCTRVQTRAGDTYLYNINAYADSAQGWATEGHPRNEFLIRGFDGSVYCFFRDQDPFNIGDDLQNCRLAPKKIAPSVTKAIEYNVATGIILEDTLQEKRTSGSEAGTTSEFISCYLLNFKSLLSR